MKRKSMVTTSVLVVALAATFNASARNLIQNKGSDTLFNVAQAWAEALRP